jgi:hypothetical protein
MKLVNGMIEMEKDGWPGSVGDSMAETSRLDILAPKFATNLAAFQTAGGFLRHPTLLGYVGEHGDSWGIDDTSSDQLLPFVLALNLSASWFKIPGTKTICSPGLFFAVRGMWRSFAWTVRAQNLIFALPYRWSDSKKWFEKSSGSSADYLNYFVSIVFLRRMGIWIDPRPETEEKIRSYYASEPNSAWLLDEYRKHFWIQIPKPLSFPTP